MTINFFKEKLLNELANCSNSFEDLQFFYNYFEYLDDLKLLVFTDNSGTKFPEYLNNNENDNFYVFNLGFTKKYYYLDKRVFIDFCKKGKTNLFFDTLVNLDTNAVSYLKKVFEKPNNVCIPDHLQKMFCY